MTDVGQQLGQEHSLTSNTLHEFDVGPILAQSRGYRRNDPRPVISHQDQKYVLFVGIARCWIVLVNRQF